MANVPALDLTWRSAADVPALHEHLYVTLDDFEPLAIHDHESADGWRVFFKTTTQRDSAETALRTSHGNELTDIVATEVADEGWARRSQANLKAIRVGRIIVAPPWDAAIDSPEPGAPRSQQTAIRIVIDPSTGFGTGHHETTRLCLRLLQDLDVKDRRAIDVGTGSGVLAIAAWELGASSVIAIDDDPEALRNARENVERNEASAAVELLEADLANLTVTPAEVVMANLTSAVLQRHAGRLAGLVESGGWLIVSGFAPHELPDVLMAFRSDSARPAIDGEWAAALLQFTHPRTQS